MFTLKSRESNYYTGQFVIVVPSCIRMSGPGSLIDRFTTDGIYHASHSLAGIMHTASTTLLWNRQYSVEAAAYCGEWNAGSEVSITRLSALAIRSYVVHR